MNELHEILTGLLLGDGTIEMRGKNPRFAVSRAIKDLSYLEWNYSYFKDWCLSGISLRERFDNRTQKTYSGCSFRTCAKQELLPYYHKWYSSQGKCIPRDLELTPLMLAIWFLDDGHIEKRRLSLKTLFATNSFTKEDVIFLRDKLNTFLDAKFTISRVSSVKKQYVICGSNDASKKLFRIIDSVIPTGTMDRKTFIWRDSINRLYEDVEFVGENRVNSKLTNEKVLAIRNEYSSTSTSYLELANKYDVCFQTIGQIITRKTWRHI